MRKGKQNKVKLSQPSSVTPAIPAGRLQEPQKGRNIIAQGARALKGRQSPGLRAGIAGVTLKGPQIESCPLKYGKDEKGNTVVSVAACSADDPTRNLYQERLKEVTGVNDAELADSILSKGMRAIEATHRDQANNIVLQTLSNLQPKDVIEARLIIQETALHAEVMNCLRHLSNSEGVGTAELYLNMALKLVRIHNETIDILSRYRRGGSQTVNVQHTVVDNRAIVNNFTGVGELNRNKGENPCSANFVVQKHAPMAINHADSQQWPTENAAYTEENALDLRQHKEKRE